MSLSSPDAELYDLSQFTAVITLAILLGQGFPHCPRFHTAAFEKLGPCLSPHVADHPLRSTKGLRLGKLLPFQQPEPASRNSKATNLNLPLKNYLTAESCRNCNAWGIRYASANALVLLRPTLDHSTDVLRTRALLF